MAQRQQRPVHGELCCRFHWWSLVKSWLSRVLSSLGCQVLVVQTVVKSVVKTVVKTMVRFLTWRDGSHVFAACMHLTAMCTPYVIPWRHSWIVHYDRRFLLGQPKGIDFVGARFGAPWHCHLRASKLKKRRQVRALERQSDLVLEDQV